MDEQKKPVSIFLCGVGGQGIIKLGDVIAEVAFRAGFDVKKNEIHGLSQRGGSVTSHVKFGPEVHSPVIMEGAADFVVALEELEALRKAHFSHVKGRILVNRQHILPASCVAGGREYPGDIAARLAGFATVEYVDAFETARRRGDVRMTNMGMAGALSKFLEFEESLWEKVIREMVPATSADNNMNVFKDCRAQLTGA